MLCVYCVLRSSEAPSAHRDGLSHESGLRESPSSGTHRAFRCAPVTAECHARTIADLRRSLLWDAIVRHGVLVRNSKLVL